MRRRIVVLLRERPLNAHQLAKRLDVNYATVQHHLDVLERNALVTGKGPRYGRMYFLTPQMEKDYTEMQHVWPAEPGDRGDDA